MSKILFKYIVFFPETYFLEPVSRLILLLQKIKEFKFCHWMSPYVLDSSG